MKRVAVTVLALATLPAAASAQHEHARSPYATAAIDTALTMPLEEAEALRLGEGMGLALVAELNHYPGPKHAIELAAMIGLSQEQLDELERIREAMTERAVAEGAGVLEAEAQLTTLFRSGRATLDEVEALTLRIGEARGRLRAVHLRAHLETRAVLTPAQIRDYDLHRGYQSR